MTKTTDDLQGLLYEAGQILDRAKLITGDAPFWMICDDDFAEILIDGESACLRWPEAHSGYYDSCSIEVQSCTFPSALLLMSIDEIKAWKVEQRKLYDAEQKEKKEREAQQRAADQTANELRTLAALKAKYGT
jgi:hypothetical protein